MATKPTYEELEQRTKELEKEVVERRRSEEAVQKREKELRIIAENVPGLFSYLDKDGYYRFTNKRYEEWFGLSQTDMVGKNYRQVLGEATYETMEDHVNRVLSGERVRYEEALPDKHGGTRYVIADYIPDTDESGKVNGFFALVTDVTEHKRAEEELRVQSEIAANMSEGVYLIRASDGVILYTNPRFEEIFGYDPGEMVGKYVSIVNDPTEMTPEETVDHIVGILKQTGLWKGEIQNIKKDGTPFWCYASASLFDHPEYGEIIISVHTDITERKRAEEALRESNENLDKAQELAHIGNWSRDLNFNLAQWSDETYRIYGLTPGDPAQPSFETFLSRVHPEDRERVTSMLKEAAEKKLPFDYEFRTVPIEGSERIIRTRGEVEYDETGTPSRIFGTPQDITETRRLQAQLLESQKTEAIVVLAGGIAHRFNNALVTIIGCIDLIKMAHGENETTMEKLKDMKASALIMAQLTSQLLAYARGGRYNPEVLSSNGFVEATLPLIQHTLDPTVRVETDLPPDVMNVKADGTQMQMVLSAIVANSKEAMEGPGRIRISTRNMDLGQKFIKDHPGLKPGPHVCLSVKDDGKGMDKETRRRIFDPFFTTHFMGRGLGMAAVYGIIRNHDGAIVVDSELGKGTTVHIYLPAIEVEKEVEKKTVSRPDLQLPKGDATILVIEDEENVMMLIRKVLETLGYRVLQAETGKKAINLAKAFDGQIDLALLDIKLPDLSANQVYRLIMEARPDIKVIVCSGYSIDGPTQVILDAGAEGFIQKPFHIAAFAEKLKDVLEGK